MAVAGSLQLSHDLGLCGNRGYCTSYKGSITIGKWHLLGLRLSSQFLWQEPWNFRLSGGISRSVHNVRRRNTGLKCRSFLEPRQAFGLSAVKSAGTALMRSCNALQSSPLILKVVPAVGIIIFALWGLRPLVRNSRNLFITKGEGSWKKSSTYYVTTTYIQPLLLWSGAILICRALDPVVLPTEASQTVKQRLLNFVRSLSTVLAFAYCLTGVIQQAQKFFMESGEASDTRNMGFQFAGKAVYSAVWVAAISLFMELLGFSTQRWLTAGGLGTVLITLAGREIFTNFLSSMMIHATRPFVLSEWIQTKIDGYDVSGTVEHVGWWSPTIIRGDDREAVHIPNHKFTVNVVRNLSQKTHWRIKTYLAISHLDVNKINNIVADMRKVLSKNPQVEQQRLHRRVFLENINPENQALMILVSCFVKTSRFEEYLCVKEAILLDLLRVISHHRARLATPIRTVQKIYGDVDLENAPYADSSFSPGGMSPHRPLLLIEPPYRINGEDRTKTHPGRTTLEQDSKAAGKVVADSKVDAKVGATAISDSNAGNTLTSEVNTDAKSGEEPFNKEELFTTASNSDLRTGDKLKVESSAKAVPRTNYKSLDKMSFDPNVQGLDSGNSVQKIPDKKHQMETGPGNNLSINPASSSSETVSNKDSGSQGQESERLASGKPASPRSVLEENIVLGVALEGSRRTLPIEEGMDLPQSSAESKDLASSGNENGSRSNGMDKKNGQVAQVPQKSGDKQGPE